jgi:hypothetical protein
VGDRRRRRQEGRWAVLLDRESQSRLRQGSARTATSRLTGSPCTPACHTSSPTSATSALPSRSTG